MYQPGTGEWGFCSNECRAAKRASEEEDRRQKERSRRDDERERNRERRDRQAQAAHQPSAPRAAPPPIDAEAQIGKFLKLLEATAQDPDTFAATVNRLRAAGKVYEAFVNSAPDAMTRSYWLAKAVDPLKAQLASIESGESTGPVSENRECPRCISEVPRRAQVCRHCRHEFEDFEAINAAYVAEVEAWRSAEVARLQGQIAEATAVVEEARADAEARRAKHARETAEVEERQRRLAEERAQMGRLKIDNRIPVVMDVHIGGEHRGTVQRKSSETMFIEPGVHTLTFVTKGPRSGTFPPYSLGLEMVVGKANTITCTYDMETRQREFSCSFPILTADAGARIAAEASTLDATATPEERMASACAALAGNAYAHVTPNISDKRIKNARKHYRIPEGATITAIWDTTLLGSAKNGWAICSDGGARPAGRPPRGEAGAVAGFLGRCAKGDLRVSA